MPFVRPELIQALWRARSGRQAVVPVWEGKRQPLCAFYSQAAKKEIGLALERKEFAVRAAVEGPDHD
jgi:molybdopterin-guanine dinucleotide biosynthesis protein A